MKTIKILFLAFCASIFPILVAGCCRDSCCGEDLTSYPYYKVTGWDSKIVRLDSTTTNGYTNTSEIEIFPIDSLFYYKAGITLSSHVSYYSTILAGFGSLMACDPVPSGYNGAKERITSLTIVSNASFDNSHPAGSNLADILKIRIKNYIRAELNERQELNAYLSSSPQPAQFYTLLFTKAPELGKKHTFTITYKQSDGQEFINTTNELIFKR